MLQVIRDLGPRAELIDIMDASKCGHIQAHHPSSASAKVKCTDTTAVPVSHVRAVDGLTTKIRRSKVFEFDDGENENCPKRT